MKFTSKISHIAQVLLISCSLASCNYLDVIPPAQADFDDTMKDESTTLGFLYSCYGGVPRSNPFYFKTFEMSNDEEVLPPDYEYWGTFVSLGTLSAASASEDRENLDIWQASYNHIGYVHRFLSQIDEMHPVGVTDEDKAQYKAECYFLEAYYHFRVLQAFGPCAIIESLVDPNITNTEIPGRSHFDYCVDWIVKKLDDAAAVLPPTCTNERDLGRATSTICKALKARVLLYAASPLWNGSFPYPNWRNTDYETPGYGKELVSLEYSSAKWERAKTACEEALEAAKSAGYALFDLETADAKATNDRVGLPYVPGKEEEDPAGENELFKRRVRMYQYLATANEGDGNKELIWGIRISQDGNNSGEATTSHLPVTVVRRSNGNYSGGWGSHAPTLYAAQHFYTEDGKLPALDENFYPESDWYTRYNTDAESPELTTDQLDGEDVKNDIIKLHVGREPRFYAWIAFDGCQYAQLLNNGGPLWLNLKNTNTNGWSTTNARNCAGTGYLSKKFVDPKIRYGSDGSVTYTAIRRPFIRMAELYLNLAECCAALSSGNGDANATEALSNLNEIRRRAGFDDLTASDITASGMTLTDWVRNERFVELFEEGHRYYDLRRWMIAPQQVGAGARYGLNGRSKANPTFEEFNTPTPIDQAFTWDNRLYLLPVWTTGGTVDELYSNPQMVQAPGY